MKFKCLASGWLKLKDLTSVSLQIYGDDGFLVNGDKKNLYLFLCLWGRFQFHHHDSLHSCGKMLGFF